LLEIVAEPKNGTRKRGWRSIVGRERKEEGETQRERKRERKKEKRRKIGRGKVSVQEISMT